jgi:hypothetical protein
LDGAAIAEALTANPNLEIALRAYEDARLGSTAQIVLSNRRHGPEIVMQIVEERAPNGFTLLSDVISYRELEEIANRYKAIAGFDRARLNAQRDS